MADPKEDGGRQASEDQTRTVGSPKLDRIDTNEKADEVATIVQPDGQEIESPHPSKKGRP